MSLINCKECNKEISDKADNCPYCGAKPTLGFGCSSILIVFFLIFIVLAVIRGGGGDTSAAPEPINLASSAKGACMEFIKKTLHDPDSAEFGLSSEAYADETSTGNWTVQRQVRAKNGFNAMRLSTFECTIASEGNNWNLLKIKELP